mmetsp:Transcript_40982/g.78259  ORF Transcript_40982/g.78259 Transcript_40982/m.78259 type:complete len:231 (+) Transcript_40982:1432-2124(+)
MRFLAQSARRLWRTVSRPLSPTYAATTRSTCLIGSKPAQKNLPSAKARGKRRLPKQPRDPASTPKMRAPSPLQLQPRRQMRAPRPGSKRTHGLGPKFAVQTSPTCNPRLWRGCIRCRIPRRRHPLLNMQREFSRPKFLWSRTTTSPPQWRASRLIPHFLTATSWGRIGTTLSPHGSFPTAWSRTRQTSTWDISPPLCSLVATFLRHTPWAARTLPLVRFPTPRSICLDWE